MTYHIAQLNIAQGLGEMDSEIMAPFVAELDRINALAERSPGFLWRLKDESGNATDIQVFDDPKIIVNMSVWESTDHLFEFVYHSAHTAVMARRREWFEAMKEAYNVLWWVEAGTEPTLVEAKARLEHLREHGPTPHAFTFKKPFDAPGAEEAVA
ncbi:MAG: DUF3291 domain-containing protein [Rhodospirillales bacterium]|nr:DUF3291 domain-containing protein [Rhodospirillales bacterium]MBO6786458.1 DUF3291 domain-containing protein [Rhodospirillales bacterium]